VNNKALGGPLRVNGDMMTQPPGTEGQTFIEYHGWAVLLCHIAEWTDDDWDRAEAEVKKAVAALRPEDGHVARVDWPANGGSVVALNGWAASADAALATFRRIGEVVPHSYGEIVVFPGAEPDSGESIRYIMRGGVTTQV
jgi:hypothetical protein